MRLFPRWAWRGQFSRGEAARQPLWTHPLCSNRRRRARDVDLTQGFERHGSGDVLECGGLRLAGREQAPALQSRMRPILFSSSAVAAV